MTSLAILITLASSFLLQQGCNGQAAERQYFGSRGAIQPQTQPQPKPQPASVSEDQQEDQNQVRSRLQQEQQNFLAFVQQQGLLRQTAPAYPYVLGDATPRSSPEYQLAQLQYQQQILQQQQKVLQLQLQQQRLQTGQPDRATAVAQPQPYQAQPLQKSPPATLLGVAFSPATSVAHTSFYGNGINYQYR
ncbi:mediator of RNA polymerase II transcription subunit 15 [Nilaparvata lugens]|uniref:mediator of RNA polymerase II transcription subunit 15 n=1 Tax=Nilaparvata lugens TaxID=108931 RepID=UPI00193CC275|nr:mediator of RNA polymerase II transcription subunit 15 [Nilaparvata lugens]